MVTTTESRTQEQNQTTVNNTTIIDYDEMEELSISYQTLPEGIPGFTDIPSMWSVLTKSIASSKGASEQGFMASMKSINQLLASATRPQFGWRMGTVTSVRKWNELSIEGSGGGGSISGGGGSFHVHDGYGHGHISSVRGHIDPIKISSNNTSKVELWFRRKDGSDDVISFTGEMPVKEGNLVSLIYVRNTGFGCKIFALHNHSVNSWIQVNPVCERPMKKRTVQVMLSFFAAPICAGLTVLDEGYGAAILGVIFTLFIISPLLYLSCRFLEYVWRIALGIPGANSLGRRLFCEVSNLKLRDALRYYRGQRTH